MENDTMNAIEAWLLAEGYTLNKLSHENTQWLLEARDPDNRPFLIGLQKTPEDQIRIQATLSFDPGAQSRFTALSKEDRDNYLWEVKFRLLQMGLNFTGFGDPMQQVAVVKSLYLDGFNKNLFIHTLETVRNALLVVLWSFHRELAEDPDITGGMIH
jgi:hypothetical protein